MVERKSLYRIAIILLILINITYLAVSYTAAKGTGEYELQQDVTESRDDITVITTQSFARTIRKAEIVAYGADGNIIYYNDTHNNYLDVDPVSGTQASVVFVATDGLNASQCGGTGCNQITIERVNLSTGESQIVYQMVATGKFHDIDRINATHYAIADIAKDRVYIIDIKSGVIEWGWMVQHDYPVTGGGVYPSDWTHMNDIEVLQDGRLMVSLRNQDQVVFVDRDRGLLESWTLGCEDCHDILYGQHNPDYLNKTQGGPAVLVSDSENSRVVEFQRQNGEWVRTWTWEDEHLDWPRDADRLPNGNTLITDSRGDRVIEVAPNGTIVWSVEIGLPYEAERLGTGSESHGGPSAAKANIESQTVTHQPDIESVGIGFRDTVKSLFPREIRKAAIFITPSWVYFYELLSIIMIAVLVVGWAFLEISWSRYSVRIKNPIRITK